VCIAKKFVDGCEEVRKATGSGTSKSQSKPKPKPRSKSFFFSDGTITPFVSAAEDLARRRAERKTAAGNEDTPATSASASSDRNTTSSQDSQSLSPGSSPAETFSLPPSAAASHAPVAGTPASSSSIISVSAGQDAKKPSLKDLYHFYLDSSGFEYKTMLVRTNYYANNMARYRLSILESHAKPHVYCTFVEYMPPTGSVLRVGGGGGVDEAELRRTLEGFNKSTGSHEATQPSPMPTYGTAVQPPTPTSSSSPPAEVTRLHTLITPPIPSSTAPYKALVAPQHSTFAAAWLAFRHTFRDLTLLSWEERFDESKTLQKARAQHFGVEPFVYIKPKPALPVGLRTQNPALFQGQTLCRDRDPKGGETPNDDGYVFNRFNLPGLVQPLQRGGAIGSVLLREADERRAWDAARVRDNAKKVDWRYRPLFNGVTGRPQKQGGGRPMGMRR
jgi:hypothetical protein